MPRERGQVISGKMVFTDDQGHKIEDTASPITENHDVVVPITGLHIDQIVRAGPNIAPAQPIEYTFDVNTA